MPRQKRQFEVGGIYHIINRGVEKRKIFLKNQDYSRFVLGLEFFNRMVDTNLWDYITTTKKISISNRLKEERSKNNNPIVEILAFALMPNHYHLVVREIKNNGISLFMNKMGGYSSYFNKQYNRVGTLFQSRYKSVTIKSDAQLDVVFNYVHSNPVELKESKWKDGIVKNYHETVAWLEDYKWSSYCDYIGKPMFQNVIQTDFFLGFYENEKECKKAVRSWIKHKSGV